MRILFVFSDYLSDWYGDFSSVLFDFISELRRRCDVRCVFLAYKHRNVSFPQGIVDAVFSPECVFEAFSTDARIERLGELLGDGAAAALAGVVQHQGLHSHTPETLEVDAGVPVEAHVLGGHRSVHQVGTELFIARV